MAFKFKIDPGGNLISDAKTVALQQNPGASRFNMQVDQSGNVISAPSVQGMTSLQQQGMQTAQQYTQQAQPGRLARVGEAFTGSDRETEKTRNLPELSLDMEAYLNDPIGAIKTTAGLLIASDEEGRRNVLKKWNPDIQITQDEKGNDIVTMPDGEQAVLNKPGFSKADAYRLLFDTALFAGGGLASGAVKGGALVKGLVGGVSAATTEFGRQKASQALGTEEQTDVGRIAATGLAGAASEFIPAKLRARGEAKAAERIGTQQELATEAAKKAARADVLTEKTGIELGRAQKTGSLSDLGRMEYISRLPGAEQKAMKFLEKQNKQAYKAVTNLMDAIGPSESVGVASRKTRKAAQDIIGGAVEERAKAAKPLYEKAFQDKNLYSPQKTIDYIDSQLKNLPPGGAREKALKKVKSYFKGSARESGDIDYNTPITTGSPDKNLTIRKKQGAFEKFDGVFASPGEVSEYGGKYQHTFYPRKGRVAEAGDSSLDYNKAISTLKKEYPGESKEFYDDLYELTASDKNVYDYGSNPLEKYGYDDLGDASWEYQNIRGKIAAAQDFDAIAVSDEFGTSYFIPYGSKALKKGDKSVGGQTIQQLDETKIEIDGMIGKALRDGDKRLASNLQQVKENLLKEVDELNPDYKAAREIYAKRSPGIQELEESTIGAIANKKDEQIKTVARTLFEPDKNLFDPQSVKQARELISKQDPEAWNGIVRAEWQRRLGKARITPEDLTAGENVPGKLRSKVFGSGKERETLYAALNTEQKKNARYLEEALKRAEKGRNPGSPTAKNLSVYEKELRKGIAGGLRSFLKDIRGTIAGAGEDVAYDAKTKAIAEVMFDPKWKPQMTDLRKLLPQSPAAKQKFMAILKSALKSAAVSQTPESPAAARKAIEILNNEE